MKFTIEFPVVKNTLLGKHHFFVYPRTQIDLLKPLLGAERTVDALGHYHECISQTSNPTGSYGARNQLVILTGYFFHIRYNIPA